MVEKEYYSIRTGRHSKKFGLVELKRFFNELYSDFYERQYFGESIGYYDRNIGEYIKGNIPDISRYIFFKLRKYSLWPISKYHKQYSEDDIFDLIELLYDLIAEPTEEFTYKNELYYTYNQANGRATYLKEFNTILRDYNNGYELLPDGRIVELIEPGLKELLLADIPATDEENVDKKIIYSISKFCDRHSIMLPWAETRNEKK
jgi:hypothetical protein